MSRFWWITFILIPYPCHAVVGAAMGAAALASAAISVAVVPAAVVMTITEEPEDDSETGDDSTAGGDGDD